ncbi:MAG: ChaN family lipoprotein [Myxococcota bacterium]
MIANLESMNVVYLGERHDRPEDHRVQTRIYKALSRRLAHPSLGFEMFQRPFQPALDRWSAGEIDEAEMLVQTEYAKRWGYDFSLYRPLLLEAKRRNAPLIALNAAAELTRTVARGGIEALSPEQRASLPELDLGQLRHRDLVLAALREHEGVTEEMLENFYAAQVIWDETMALGVAQALSREDIGSVVVIAGMMHVWEGLGIPERAARRGATPYATVLVMDANNPEIRLDGSMGTWPADYLWFVEDALTNE